jgi:hypothetical protein
MTLRVVGLLLCLLAMLLSAQSVLAQPELPLACCSKIGDCGLMTCCDWEVVADLPCSSEESGYCQWLCVRPAAAR